MPKYLIAKTKRTGTNRPDTGEKPYGSRVVAGEPSGASIHWEDTHYDQF